MLSLATYVSGQLCPTCIPHYSAACASKLNSVDSACTETILFFLPVLAELCRLCSMLKNMSKLNVERSCRRWPNFAATTLLDNQPKRSDCRTLMICTMPSTTASYTVPVSLACSHTSPEGSYDKEVKSSRLAQNVYLLPDSSSEPRLWCTCLKLNIQHATQDSLADAGKYLYSMHTHLPQICQHGSL